MSELREECYECLNNQSCIPGADYGSIYCSMYRKYKMPEHKEDREYAHKFSVMQQQIIEKDKRIQELENRETELKQYNKIVSDRIVEYKKNSIPKQVVIDKVNEINKKYEDSKDENGESPYYYPDFTIRILQGFLKGEK